MFQLSNDEFSILKSQFATSRWGGRRKPPSAFIEYGVLMLSCVLNSEKAIQVNIRIMRIFTKFNKLLNDKSSPKLEVEVIKKQLSKHHKDIQLVFSLLDKLIDKSEKTKTRKKIGYKLPKRI